MQLLAQLRQQLRQLPKAGFSTIIAPAGDFSQTQDQATNFFTALTLQSLNTLAHPELELVRQNLNQQLRTVRSSIGSWNYWHSAASAKDTRPLPDDLDTTSCSLLALAQTPEGIPGEWLADAVHLLTQCETQPGGPYRTWLVSRTAEPVWHDVDIVVNANIARLLAHYGSSPPALQTFLDSAISDRTRTSPYYPDRLLFRYFLTGWYRGPSRTALVQECEQALEQALQATSLQTLALALVTANRLAEISPTRLQQARDELIARCTAQTIVAESTCIDAIRGDVYDLAGCQAFTLAVCLEALTLASPKPVSPPSSEDALENSIIVQAQGYLQDLQLACWPTLQKTLETAVRSDKQKNLTLFPFRVAQAAVGTLPLTASALDLGAAHLFGWLAATIYDDVADDEAAPPTLWQANIFQRLSLQLFLQVDLGSEWRSFCREVMNRMDAMNLKEHQAWRLQDKLLPSLPSLDFGYLTERSLGVLLAPVALCRLAGKQFDDPLITAVKNFLLHLIAARQLSDDAHDWQEDLALGRLNSASVLIFQQTAALSDQQEQQRIFWHSIIDELQRQVTDHCAAARLAAHVFSGQTAVVEVFLSTVQQGMRTAQTERDFAQQFQVAYLAPHSAK